MEQFYSWTVFPPLVRILLPSIPLDLNLSLTAGSSKSVPLPLLRMFKVPPVSAKGAKIRTGHPAERDKMILLAVVKRVTHWDKDNLVRQSARSL